MISNTRDQLVRDEGLRLKPYVDTAGKTSIGVGRNLTDVGITIAEAKFLLDNDLAIAKDQLAIHFPWVVALSPARYGVLVNMAFNLGCDGLGEFKNFLHLTETGDFLGAGRAMLDSKWAQQVGVRAQRLSRQMVTDVWQ